MFDGGCERQQGGDGDAVLDNGARGRRPRGERNILDSDRRTKCLEVDGGLRHIARSRSMVDGAEVKWLRDADRLDVHEVMGFGSLVSYLEHTLGYSPRVALDRLRVARCLDDLPLIAQRLAAGHLHYTTVRELTRVATRATEQRWLDAIFGKSTRQVQSMVEGHTVGDLPDDPIDPRLITRTLVLEVTPEVLARYREVRNLIDAERGERCGDSEIVSQLCESWCGAPASISSAVASTMDATDSSRPSRANKSIDRGRARYQLAITICSSCKRGTQDGGGLIAPILPSTAARAECDAQRIGSIETTTGGPTRATQDIAPATRRFIWRRDHGRCQAPGCNAARHIEIHHILAREHGGTHQASNLLLLCDGCHTRIHDGSLVLRGTAPDELAFDRPNMDTDDWEARARARASTKFERQARDCKSEASSCTREHKSDELLRRTITRFVPTDDGI